MQHCEIREKEEGEEIWLILPLLSPIRSHFPDNMAKQREREDVQMGACATQGSAVGAYPFSSSFAVMPGSRHLFLVVSFGKCLGVAQPCFDRQEK